MNTPIVALPIPVAALPPDKKRRVLLVDTSSHRRELRAEVMRKLGIEVDSAADIAEARSWWRADLYHLVLINVENDTNRRDGFCDDIRSATPPQQLAFLVGKPEYLANAPSADEASAISGNGEPPPVPPGRSIPSAEPVNLQQRWGILEASRRISEVRSTSVARTRALRERPVPPRDSEGRSSKRLPVSATLDDLLREELR
jgi:CheY-like chemotaxis protein